MSRTWHFVAADGLPTGATFIGPKHALAANTPDGCCAVEGPLPTQRCEIRSCSDSGVMAQIAALERKQARPMRELVRDPANRTARLRIDEIDIEIGKLRAEL